MRTILVLIPTAIAVMGLCLMVSGKIFCRKGTGEAKTIFWWSYGAIIVGITIQTFIWICEKSLPITEFALATIAAIFVGNYLSQKETRSQRMPKSLIFWGGIIAAATLFICMIFAGKEMTFPRG